MKIKNFLFILVAFSVFLTVVPDVSYAGSAKPLKRDSKEKEAQRIEKFEDNVKREGDTLLLKSDSGSDISLKDSPGCERPDSCVRYSFVEYFKEVRFFLVRGYYFEETKHIMISESDGRKYSVHDLPVLSPDKRRIVTAPDRTNTGYNENGLFIWRIEGTELIPEFSYDLTENAGYKIVRWKNNEFIKIEKWFLSSKGPCPMSAYTVVPVELKMEAGGWKLHEDYSPHTIECINGFSRKLDNGGIKIMNIPGL